MTTAALIITFTAGFTLGLLARFGTKAVRIMFEGLRA